MVLPTNFGFGSWLVARTMKMTKSIKWQGWLSFIDKCKLQNERRNSSVDTPCWLSYFADLFFAIKMQNDIWVHSYLLEYSYLLISILNTWFWGNGFLLLMKITYLYKLQENICLCTMSLLPSYFPFQIIFG